MSDNPTDSDLDDRVKMSWRDFIKFLEATGAALLYHLFTIGKSFWCQRALIQLVLLTVMRAIRQT